MVVWELVSKTLVNRQSVRAGRAAGDGDTGKWCGSRMTGAAGTAVPDASPAAAAATTSTSAPPWTAGCPSHAHSCAVSREAHTRGANEALMWYVPAGMPANSANSAPSSPTAASKHSGASPTTSEKQARPRA